MTPSPDPTLADTGEFGVVAGTEQHVLALREQLRERRDKAELADVGQGRVGGGSHVRYPTGRPGTMFRQGRPSR